MFNFMKKRTKKNAAIKEEKNIVNSIVAADLKNKILEYVKKENTDYAIMVNGDWGSGKTYFIEKELKIESSNLYRISLFGIESIHELTREIEKKVFPNYYITKDFLSVLSGTLKIDEKFDINSETINNIVKEVSNYLSYKNKVIVFDDIERHSPKLHMSEILGFVNNLVENLSAKVIVLCNRNQITKDAETMALYQEKSIRECYYLKPDINKAYNSLVDLLIVDDVSKKFFFTSQKDLLEPFKISECVNIRTLKYVFEKFIELRDAIDNNEIKNNEFILQILFISLSVFTIEYKKGKDISFADIVPSKHRYSNFNLYISNDSNKENKLSDKYRPLIRYIEPIKSIENLVINGVFDKEEFNQRLLVYCPSSGKTNDAMVKLSLLFHPTEIDDDEFFNVIDKVKQYISEGKYSLKEIFEISMCFDDFDYYKLSGFSYSYDSNLKIKIYNAAEKELQKFNKNDITSVQLFLNDSFKNSKNFTKSLVSNIKNEVEKMKSNFEQKEIEDFFKLVRDNSTELLSAYMEDINNSLIITYPKFDVNEFCESIYSANQSTRRAFELGCYRWFPTRIQGEDPKFVKRKLEIVQNFDQYVKGHQLTPSNLILKNIIARLRS